MTTNRIRSDDPDERTADEIRAAAAAIILSLPEDAMKGFDSFSVILSAFSAAALLMMKLNNKLTDGEKDRLRDNDGWEIMGLKAFEAARNEMYSLVEKTDPKQN